MDTHSKVGRPPIEDGVRVELKLPQRVADYLDGIARAAGASRAEIVRRAILALYPSAAERTGGKPVKTLDRSPRSKAR